MNDMILSGTTTEELAAVVAARSPGLTHEEVGQIAEQAARLQISPEAMQKILEGFETVAEALRKIADAIVEILKPVIEWAAKVARRFMEAIAAGIVPGKWLHLAKHAKKARTRKKYRKRIREAVIAFLCTSRKEVTA